jgi:hypothetical protein
MAHDGSGSEHKSLGEGFQLVSAFVSVVIVCAFAMSSAYVSGIQESEHIEIISHLLPTDYIVITPQWLVPAAPTLLSVFLFLIALFSFFLRNPPDDVVHRFIRIRGWPFWVLTGTCTILLLIIAPQANDPGYLPQGLFPREVRRGLLLAILPVLICFVYIGFCAPLVGIFLGALPDLLLNPKDIFSKPARGAVRPPWPDLAITKNRLRLMWASVILGLLLFVHYIGYSYAPAVLRGNPAVDVVVQTTASTTTQFRGKVLFVVTHATLLVEDQDEHEYHRRVIIVPNDKIVSLETVNENPLPNKSSSPLLKSTPLPNPSATSSPTPASTPTPAPSPSPSTPTPPTTFVPTPSPVPSITATPAPHHPPL